MRVNLSENDFLKTETLSYLDSDECYRKWMMKRHRNRNCRHDVGRDCCTLCFASCFLIHMFCCSLPMNPIHPIYHELQVRRVSLYVLLFNNVNNKYIYLLVSVYLVFDIHFVYTYTYFHTYKRKHS